MSSVNRYCKHYISLLTVVFNIMSDVEKTVGADRVVGILRKLDRVAGRQSDDVHMPIAIKGDVFVPKSLALSYLHAAKRTVYDYDDGWNDGAVGGGGQQGLACECCVHMCTYREMLEYCDQTPLRKRLALSQTDR